MCAYRWAAYSSSSYRAINDQAHPAASVRIAAAFSNSRSSTRTARPRSDVKLRILPQQHRRVAVRHVQQPLVLDRIGQPEPRQSRLLRAQHVAAAAQPEILVRDQEPIVGIAQQRQPPPRRVVHPLLVQQQTEARVRSAPDPPAQLVQLRQPEAFGMLDHHHRRRRHIDADLDHRRRHQQPASARRRTPPASRRAPPRPAGHAPAPPRRRTARAARRTAPRPRPGPAPRSPPPAGTPNRPARPRPACAPPHPAHPAASPASATSAHRLPPGRLLGQAADTPSRPTASAAACAGSASRSSPARRSARPCRPAAAAGRRRTGAARRSPPAPDRDTPRSPGTARACRRPCGTEPSFSPRSSCARARPFTAAGQQRHRLRRQPGQRAVMLLGQHLGRRHHRRLRARFHRTQHRQQRHQRLARADIALQQAQHAPLGRQIGVDLRQRLTLRRRSACSRTAPAPWPAALPSPVSARPGRARTPPAHHRQRHLVRQQLVIGEPRRACARPGSSLGRLHGAQRLGECRPFLPPQQRRIVPFRQFGQPPRAPGPSPRPPAAATARRSAARPARSPAAAPAGRPAPHDRDAASSAGRRTRSILPDTSSCAPDRHLPFAAEA